jgi:AbrB family looped-hinge helix DNA binding protein
MQTVTLSSKGQLVIPKALRDQVHLNVGDELAVRVIGGEIRLRRLQMQAPSSVGLDAVAGCLAQIGQQKGRKKLSETQVRQAIALRLKSRDAASRNAANDS